MPGAHEEEITDNGRKKSSAGDIKRDQKEALGSARDVIARFRRINLLKGFKLSFP